MILPDLLDKVRAAQKELDNGVVNVPFLSNVLAKVQDRLSYVFGEEDIKVVPLEYTNGGMRINEAQYPQ